METIRLLPYELYALLNVSTVVKNKTGNMVYYFDTQSNDKPFLTIGEIQFDIEKLNQNLLTKDFTITLVNPCNVNGPMKRHPYKTKFRLTTKPFCNADSFARLG